ncbi:hypothetical protein CCMA1212_002815 [Trichoderma ghanense]|uniref:Uncharacterized protein n=1 Tax=Trichoderma ghanense TaxID=65468 RepID=A0ABY2HAK9_9HYPO
MATTTQTQILFHNQKPSRPSSTTTTTPSLPPYEAGSYEFGALSPTSSHSSSSPPNYDTPSHHLDAYGLSTSSSSSSQPSFHCTKAFQIESQGHPLIALPTPPQPAPIPVYNVDLASGNVTHLAYESIRLLRCSGNSILIRAGDAEDDPVCKTTYRWGPGRPPRMQLTGALSHDEEFEVMNKGLATRAQVFRTHLGTFAWRYAGRGERKAVGANSLLVMDRIFMVALEGGGQEERRIPVARFVRNEEVRTRGTKATTAGNGGRLMVDLREWEGTKGEGEEVEVLVVASCLVMLKKEVDRRRMHQAVVTVSLVA